MKHAHAEPLIAIFLAACATAAAPALIRSETMSLDTPEGNKQVVRSLYEDYANRGRSELVPRLVADEFVDAQGGSGPAAFARNFESVRAGFPDIRFTVHDLVAEGDRVAVRWTWEGTHTGTFRSWGPTGKRVTTSGTVIYQLKHGKVVRAWLETDRLGVLQQIGAIPPSVVPAARPVSR